MAEIERALELDPLSTYFRFGRSYVSLFIGEDDAAADGAKLTFDLDPSYFLGYFVLSYVRARQGRYDEAISLAERMVELHGRWPMSSQRRNANSGMSDFCGRCAMAPFPPAA